MADFWTPQLAPRGIEVWNTPYRYTLVEGARRSGKTIAILNTVMRHAVQWDGAEIVLVTKYLKKGEGGCYRDLIRRRGIVDQWVRAGMTKYTKPPGYAMASKMPYFRLQTTDGGESEIQLHSLENETDVEEKFKDFRASMIVIVEADSFKDRIVFDTLRQQLRSMAIPNNQLKFIADTNPPEEGTEHWLHPLFFDNPNPQFGKIHFGIDDNPFLTEEERQDLYDTYSHDPVLLARYYHGKWQRATTDSVFHDVFSPGVHIVGDEIPGRIPETPSGLDEMDILRPWNQSYGLEAGWDIGDRNSAMVIGCLRYIGNTLCYDILDEVVSLNTNIGLDDFVRTVMEKMAYWTNWMKYANNIPNPQWRHFSDTSSLRHRMNLRGTEAMLIRQISGGAINLIGVEKGAGSVGMRKNLVRRMLYENRLYVSPLCRHTIAMFRGLPPGKSQPIEPESPHKHVFDAGSYLLGSVIPLELNMGKLGLNRPQNRHATLYA